MSEEPTKWTYRPARDLGMAPIDRLRSVRREPGLISHTIHAATLSALSAYLRLYHRLRIVNPEQLPDKPPFVVIANHASHLDALILAAALGRSVRGCTFPVAAGDVFFTSSHRSLVSSLFINALPLWRKKVTAHALADLRTRLADGDCGLILFPEGARSRDGELLPFKQGLGMIVAGTPVPVVPCRLIGAFEAMPAGKWVPRPRRIEVRVGRALRFDDCESARAGWEQVARSVESVVRAL